MPWSAPEKWLVFRPDLDLNPAAAALWANPPDRSGSLPSDRAVRAAIDAVLTPKQREAVLLFYFEGLSEAGIGQRLGVSQQVVHKRIHGVRRGGRLVGGALPRLRRALTPTVSP